MEKEQRQLLERNFGLAEQRRNIWTATVYSDATLEEITSHGFWAHIARLVRPSDVIEVMPESNEWRVDLHVIGVDSAGVNVGVLSEHDWREIAKGALDNGDAMTIRWRGRFAQYGVVRKDNGEVIKDGFPSKEAALEFLRDTSMAA
jgi:hypothetical protein